ncbi:hypothetical protein GCM10027262_60750 [Nocardia tengchongensis]
MAETLAGQIDHDQAGLPEIELVVLEQCVRVTDGGRGGPQVGRCRFRNRGSVYRQLDIRAIGQFSRPQKRAEYFDHRLRVGRGISRNALQCVNSAYSDSLLVGTEMLDGLTETIGDFHLLG